MQRIRRTSFITLGGLVVAWMLEHAWDAAASLLHWSRIDFLAAYGLVAAVVILVGLWRTYA